MRPLAASDVAWIEFNPAVGREQSGLRPAVVISSAAYNDNSSFAIVCPITGNTRNWPWKVPLPPVAGFHGSVLVDQIKSIDQRRRIRRVAGRVPDTVLVDIRRLLELLILQTA